MEISIGLIISYLILIPIWFRFGRMIIKKGFSW